MNEILAGSKYVIYGALILFSMYSFPMFIFYILDTFKSILLKLRGEVHYSWKSILLYNIKELLIMFPGAILFLYFLGSLGLWIKNG